MASLSTIVPSLAVRADAAGVVCGETLGKCAEDVEKWAIRGVRLDAVEYPLVSDG